MEHSRANVTKPVPSPALVTPLAVSVSAAKASPAELAISAPPVSSASRTLVAKCVTATDEEQLIRASSASNSLASASAWKASADDSAIAACQDFTTFPTARSASATGMRTSVTQSLASVSLAHTIPLAPIVNDARTDITAILLL